jgi:hypothetical protein
MDEDKAKLMTVDQDKAAEIRTHILDMQSDNSKKNEKAKEYEDAYNMIWDNGQTQKLKKKYNFVTISPDARNKVLGAVRLLAATDPQFTIIKDNLPAGDTKFKPDELEKALNRWWKQSGRANNKPLHYDMLLSAILYGEMHTACTPVKDLLEYAPDNRKARIEALQEMTPVLFESWNPTKGCAEFDRFDLCAYAREVDTNAMSVISDFGSMVPKSIVDGKRYSTVKLITFYDLDYSAYYMNGQCVYLKEHKYSRIPISVTLTDGSRLFDKTEDQRQPLLYGVVAGGLWEKENIMLTVLYSLVFGLGISPQFKFFTSQAAGVVELVKNQTTSEDYQQVEMNPVNKSLWDTMQLAEQKVSESTIFPQALGAAVDRVTTFSEMSLLNQSGRLPLVTTQRMGGEGIAKIMYLALNIMKDKNISYTKNGMVIKPGSIPKNLEIDVALQVNLPQDQLSLSTIATNLQQAGLVDDEFIQSKILQVNDTTGMRKKILRDQTIKVLFQEMLKERLTERAQKKAAAKVPSAPPVDPNAPPVDPNQVQNQGGPSPEEIAAMEQSAQAGGANQLSRGSVMPVQTPNAAPTGNQVEPPQIDPTTGEPL